MFDNYKVISVTPAGRKKHLEILKQYLLKNSDIIDEHHFWVNTNNQQDIDYMNILSKENDFFKVIPCPIKVDGLASIHSFFPSYIDPKTIYIRFDDDICYIAKDAIKKLLECRIKNREYLIVYPHIINNFMNTLEHSVIYKLMGKFDYYKDLKNVALLHDLFISLPEESFYTPSFQSKKGFNINCFCWFGEDFAKFDGKVQVAEEHWISELAPSFYGKQNYVCGDAIVVHYAYLTQREYLDSLNYLEKYKNILLTNF